MTASWRRVVVLCEGQTEEQFVTQVLAPAATFHDVWITPTVVETSRHGSSPSAKGGGGWRHYARDLSLLLRASHWNLVTTMIDLYAYPKDAPGADHRSTDAYQRAAVREAAIAELFPDRRLRPHVVLHEFEAYVIAAAAATGRFLGSEEMARQCSRMISECGGDPHLIDDGPLTAPSKRLRAMCPTYTKTIDGIEVLTALGADGLASTSGRFAGWWATILGRVEESS